MSKKTKHEALASYRNNGEYFFIADGDRKIYHRKECNVLDSESVRRKSLIPLRNIIGKKFSPCPQCAPVPIQTEPKKKETGPLGEHLCAIAKKYGMQAKVIGSSIYVTTVADEWFFDYKASPIILHHKNADQRTDGSGQVLAGE